MAVRKEAGVSGNRVIKRRSPLNRKIIGSNIEEARDALNKILLKTEAGVLDEVELQVGKVSR